MKKLIPLLLALVLLLSLGSTAFADGTGSSHDYAPDDSSTMSQKITAKIPENKIIWHLVIPAEVTIPAGGYEGRVNLGNVAIVIESGELTDTQKIEATLTYDGVLTDSDNSDNSINYVLSDKNADTSGESIATLQTGKAYVVGTKTKAGEEYTAPDAWVTADIWDRAESGDYAGTVVYSSSIPEAGA